MQKNPTLNDILLVTAVIHLMKQKIREKNENSGHMIETASAFLL